MMVYKLSRACEDCSLVLRERQDVTIARAFADVGAEDGQPSALLIRMHMTWLLYFSMC